MYTRCDNNELNILYPDLGILDAFKRVDTQVAEALRKMFM